MRDHAGAVGAAPLPAAPVLDDAHTLYRWALQNASVGRQVSVSFLSDPEVAVAVALGKEDAAAGCSRTRAALADAIERVLSGGTAPRDEAAAPPRPGLSGFGPRWRRVYRARPTPAG